VLYASFNLLRVKLNFVSIFSENIIRDKYRYYKYNFGGELIDISIPNGDHYELKGHFDNILDLIVKYKGINKLEGLEFYSYSIIQMFEDLYYILAEQNKYPWIDSKYEKRIQRLFSLIMLILFDSGQNISAVQYIITMISNIITLYEKYESYLQEGNNEYLTYIDKLKSLNTSQLQAKNHKIILEKICKLYIKIITNLDESSDFYDGNVVYTNSQGKIDLIKNKEYLYQPLLALKEFLEMIQMVAIYNKDKYLSQSFYFQHDSELKKEINIEHLGGYHPYSSLYAINEKNYIKLKNLNY